MRAILAEPRRRRADLGGRRGDVDEQHATSLARSSDNDLRRGAQRAPRRTPCANPSRRRERRPPRSEVCTAPVSSVARTRDLVDPGSWACQSKLHSRQVSFGVARAQRGSAATSPSSMLDLDGTHAAVLRPRHPAERHRTAGHVLAAARHVDAGLGLDRSARRPAQPGPVRLAPGRSGSARGRRPTWSPTRSRTDRAPPGVPGSRVRSGSGAPFMPIASSASRPSVSASTGVPAVNPSIDVDSTMSASE